MQAFYELQQEQQVQMLQEHYGQNMGMMHTVLEQQLKVLQKATAQAVQQELDAFTTQSMPDIAELLKSKQVLLQCFEVLPKKQQTA